MVPKRPDPAYQPIVPIRSQPAAYVARVAIHDPEADTFILTGQKTMYGGKHIVPSAEIFLFASETEGGQGLIANDPWRT